MTVNSGEENSPTALAGDKAHDLPLRAHHHPLMSPALPLNMIPASPLCTVNLLLFHVFYLTHEELIVLHPVVCDEHQLNQICFFTQS